MENDPYARLLHRWWLLVLALVYGGAVTYVASSYLPPTYESTATLVVAQPASDETLPLENLEASERLAMTFSELILLDDTLLAAIEQADLPLTPAELRESVSTEHVEGTGLVRIRGRGNSGSDASGIANAVVAAFISSPGAALTGGSGTVAVAQRALPGDQPISPRILMNVLLGSFLCLLAAGAIVLLVGPANDTVEKPAEPPRLEPLPDHRLGEAPPAEERPGEIAVRIEQGGDR